MSELLDALSRRVEGDPFFLAHPLAMFAQSESLDVAALCAFLRCPVEALPMLRLCRAPAEEPPGFQRDVERVAERVGLDADALAEAVRRGQALWRLRQAPAAAGGTLLAARDAEQGCYLGRC